MKYPPRQQELLPLLYPEDPDDQLGRARAIVCWLQAHPEAALPLVQPLPDLQRAASALARQMRHLRLGEVCSVCAAGTGGGCCSAAMANNADVPLIALNLLLGAPVRLWSHSQDLCCFLGPSGCLFEVKPIFCLNYYCQRLRSRIAAADMRQLQENACCVFARQSAWEERLLTLMRLSSIPLPQ